MAGTPKCLRVPATNNSWDRGEHAHAHSVPGVQVFNMLIDRVAQDDEYLRRTLAPAARYDDFTVCHGLCRITSMLSNATTAEAPCCTSGRCILHGLSC